MPITKLPSSAFESIIAPNDIINDISTLALREATSSDRASYNSNSSFVDVFQDSTGIDTTSTAERNSNEFVSTLVQTTSAGKRYWRASKTNAATAGSYHTQLLVFKGASNNTAVTITSGMLSSSGVSIHSGLDKLLDGSNGTFAFHTDSANVGATVTIDFGSGNEQPLTKWFFDYNSYTNAVWDIQWSSNNSDWNTVKTGYATGASDGTWSGVLDDTINATGNFTGTTITAPSSVSKMGGIFTYQDNAGTNALNTDIILQLSADGGSNFTTTTLTALPDFSTGIKMAKANDVSVTAGTSLKYKISFANQSTGSKEARIRGVSLQY